LPEFIPVSVKIGDDNGQASESDLLRRPGLGRRHHPDCAFAPSICPWSTSIPESYSTSPVDAAVENLWHAGVTVVASAGTSVRCRTRVVRAGNDPYVIPLAAWMK